MRTMDRNAKEKVFLALTRLHRDIINNNNIPSFYKVFYDAEYHNDKMIADIKTALFKMKILSVKDKKFIWNSEKTLPNPQLVDGILLTIKDLKKKNIEPEKVQVITKGNQISVLKSETVEKDSIERILKSVIKAGINPTIIIICNK